MNDPQGLQVIARGYMAPGNPGINVFAQRGVITPALLSDVEQEIALGEREAECKPTEERLNELLSMHAELDHLHRMGAANALL